MGKMRRELWNIVFGCMLAVGYAGAAKSDSEGPEPLPQSNPGAPAILAKCGQCHMAFSSRMLPARSWAAILAAMKDHFGEDAGIPSGDLEIIRGYLTANAADAPNASALDRHFLSELSPEITPLQITATPWWNQMHADYKSESFSNHEVKSPADCLGCHK